MHTATWYRNRLYKYFMVRYGEYEDFVDFLPDPSDRQWLFEIPDLDLRVKLTCYDNGRVIEVRYRMGAVKQ